ncbi:hypothetical protein HK099_008498 [Clydaea vesicula]|uniref:LIM zinc-binding domain-containing protein n=1 Tax=Clydaea vesicula TaxID=447962 RepID=A0AAD5U4U9_9FUNG|nr:hypothetical protein HK099_008498 [Clydaea vesicula]
MNDLDALLQEMELEVKPKRSLSKPLQQTDSTLSKTNNLNNTSATTNSIMNGSSNYKTLPSNKPLNVEQQKRMFEENELFKQQKKMDDLRKKNTVDEDVARQATARNQNFRNFKQDEPDKRQREQILEQKKQRNMDYEQMLEQERLKNIEQEEKMLEMERSKQLEEEIILQKEKLLLLKEKEEKLKNMEKEERERAEEEQKIKMLQEKEEHNKLMEMEKQFKMEEEERFQQREEGENSNRLQALKQQQQLANTSLPFIPARKHINPNATKLVNPLTPPVHNNQQLYPGHNVQTDNIRPQKHIFENDQNIVVSDMQFQSLPAKLQLYSQNLPDIPISESPLPTFSPLPPVPPKDDLYSQLKFPQLPQFSPPKCFTCHLIIQGPLVEAMNKTFHPKHFTCHSCKTTLSPEKFYEKKLDGGEVFPFCDDCFTTLFLPKCAYCDLSIEEDCLNAIGTNFHKNHFFCFQCGKLFPPGAGFFEKEGKAFCENDYFALFGITCNGCAKGVIGEFITAAEKEYHQECFKCEKCHKSFNSQSENNQSIEEEFFELNGKVYCEKDFFKKRDNQCFKCFNLINGPFYKAKQKESNFNYADNVNKNRLDYGNKFHVECFLCDRCSKKPGEINLGGNVARLEDFIELNENGNNELILCSNCYEDFSKEDDLNNLHYDDSSDEDY